MKFIDNNELKRFWDECRFPILFAIISTSLLGNVISSISHAYGSERRNFTDVTDGDIQTFDSHKAAYLDSMARKDAKILAINECLDRIMKLEAWVNQTTVTVEFALTGSLRGVKGIDIVLDHAISLKAEQVIKGDAFQTFQVQGNNSQLGQTRIGMAAPAPVDVKAGAVLLTIKFQQRGTFKGYDYEFSRFIINEGALKAGLIGRTVLEMPGVKQIEVK